MTKEAIGVSGFIVETGEVIGEYTRSRGLGEEEASKHMGISERQLHELFNGETRLTEDMAVTFGELMPDVPATFWLNYEVRYLEYVTGIGEECLPVERALRTLKMLEASIFARKQKSGVRAKSGPAPYEPHLFTETGERT